MGGENRTIFYEAFARDYLTEHTEPSKPSCFGFHFWNIPASRISGGKTPFAPTKNLKSEFFKTWE
ncbi:MAG: hypothetical protein DYG98_25390 [Haliscomenobacteraceae bacterium CHB4]|nr:hypothetical protein [Haliscomenobacteraceae bacterium CHB4]